jgi:hypothetical protein
MVRDGGLKVEGAMVVIDNITNDVRGSSSIQPALMPADPEEVAGSVGRLIWALKEGKSRGIIVCELKPQKTLNVTPFSAAIHQECNKWGV